MKLTIVVEDNLVGIDGEFRTVTLPDMGKVRAIQWNETAGHVELYGAPNEPIDSLEALEDIIQLWNEAAPEDTP